MCSRVFILLIRALFIYYRIFAVGLVVQSFVTSNASTAVSSCSNSSDYNFLCQEKCCQNFTCVQMNGAVQLTSGIWDNITTMKLCNAFQGLMGSCYISITGISSNNTTADLVITCLNTAIVTIDSPNTTMCYECSPVLKCMYNGTAVSANWKLIKNNQTSELREGSVVKINSCAVPGYISCTELTLQKVTGVWEGIYECGFSTGTVRYTARAQLDVSGLPDVITMETNPLIADCSENQTERVNVTVTATISDSTENYTIWWGQNGTNLPNSTPSNGLLSHTFNASFICQNTTNEQYVSVTFINAIKQVKSAQVNIPVINAQSPFCSENNTDEETWPKTPVGVTVVNRTCAAGRVGYKSRTCNGSDWQPVYNNCITQQLNQLLNQADAFLSGLKATPEMAVKIFQVLLNSSTSTETDNIADITASINILNIMANASNNNIIPEEVLPDFINASSNLLKKNWDTVNTSVLHSMSSTYLQSVEVLVKNCLVNSSQDIKSENIELKFCNFSQCNVSVFDVYVSVRKTNGILKTAAVKNLTNKLRNHYNNTNSTSLLVSATLQNNSDSSTKIQLNFPYEHLTCPKPICVFWNTTEENWSDKGCLVYSRNRNQTVCQCDHLTPFSVLMSKGEIPYTRDSKTLDMITNVGLSVSVFSLLIFLIIELIVWPAVVKTHLSHFHHTAMVNIAMFLLLADISFLASTSPDDLSENSCLILTLCKHLFYLAMFCWMLCLCVMLVHQILFVFSPLRKKVFMVLSSFVGYVCPILIVGSSYVYYQDDRYYDNETCWLVFESVLVGSIHTFLFPVGIIILTNVLCVWVIIFTLFKSSILDAKETDAKETAKGILKVLAILTPVTGITWLIGLIQLMTNKDDPMYEPVEYCFTIFNAFQGIFILLTGCFKEKKVVQAMSKILDKYKHFNVKKLTLEKQHKDYCYGGEPFGLSWRSLEGASHGCEYKNLGT